MTEATRSFSEIEAMALVLWCIKKTSPVHCSKGHFGADLYSHQGKKYKFWSFLRGDSAWPSYTQDTFESHFEAFPSFIRESKKLQPDYVVKAIWWPIFTIDLMKNPNIRRLIKKLDPNIVGNSFCDRFLRSLEWKKKQILVIFGTSVWQTQWWQQNILTAKLKPYP